MLEQRIAQMEERVRARSSSTRTRSTPRRLGRRQGPRQGPEDRRLPQVPARRLGRGQPGRGEALPRVADRQGPDGSQARRGRQRRGPARRQPGAQDHQDRSGLDGAGVSAALPGLPASKSAGSRSRRRYRHRGLRSGGRSPYRLGNPHHRDALGGSPESEVRIVERVRTVEIHPASFSPQRRWVPNERKPAASWTATLAGFGWAIRASRTRDLRHRAGAVDEVVMSSAPPMPAPRPRGVDVDGDLASAAVGAARGPGPDRGPADDFVRRGRDRDRVVGVAVGEPAVVAARLAGVDVEGRDAPSDLAVVDREYPRQVGERWRAGCRSVGSRRLYAAVEAERPRAGARRAAAMRERQLPERCVRPPDRDRRDPRLYFCIRANHKTGGLIDRQRSAEEFDPDFRWQRIPGERPGRGPADRPGTPVGLSK